MKPPQTRANEGKKNAKRVFTPRISAGLRRRHGRARTGVLTALEEAQAAPAVPVHGPHEVAITLTINGKPMNVKAEPRTCQRRAAPSPECDRRNACATMATVARAP